MRFDISLKQIADVITANTPYIKDLSLFNGKTGIALFLYHYSDFTGNSFYKEFAGKILEEVSDNISTVSSPGFLDGLTGIGWAIEYFARNGFIDTNTDEALQELDEVIFSAKLQRYITDHDNEDMFGYGLYYLSRLGNNKRVQNAAIRILKEQALLFLAEECEMMLRSKKGTYALHPNVVSSIAFFFLELNRNNIYPEKAAVVLKDLGRHFEAAERFFNDRADTGVLIQLKHAVDLVREKKMGHAMIAYNIDPDPQPETKFVYNTVNESCKAVVHELLYVPYYKSCAGRFLKDALRFFDPADCLQWFVHPSGHYNLALNNGLAGVGMAMLSSVIK